MSCTLHVYAKDDVGAPFPFIASFRFYTLKNGEWDEWNASPIEIPVGTGRGLSLSELKSHKIVPLEYSSKYETPPEIELDGCGDGTYNLIYIYKGRPTISSISWTPTGDYTTIAAGASLVEAKLGGGTTQLMLVATNPFGITDPPISEGEAILRIDTESPFIAAPGDHFRFNNKEWWALNIICGPECDMITIADETAEAEKIPKIGDEITFAAAIDWHGQEMSTIKWYYAKAPGACFDDIWDLDWEEFAVGENTNMPAHAFEAEGDEEITFFMVTATNMDFATGEIDTLCGPIFNLWKYMPSWWDSLLASLRTVNDEIAEPITALFTGGEIEGWTTPPFECPICKQVFDGEGSELEYAEHLMSHIKAFEKSWFREPEPCSEPTTNYASGCALLKNYADGDGIISISELIAAAHDRDDKVITQDEYRFVVDAYNAGSINALCPGCHT